MYGYIYMTTNLVNGKRYIGKHKSVEFVGNEYIGSGKLLKRDIKAHNYNVRTDFKVELLEECDTLESLNEREIYWISYYDACNSKEFYNIHFGGDGGDISLYLSPDDMEAIRKEHSEFIKNKFNTDKNFKKSFSGAKFGHKVTKETKSKISNKQKEYWNSVDVGVKHERLSRSATNRNIGRVWVTNDIIDKFVPNDNLNDYLNSGFRLGRKFKKRNRKCAETIESIGNEKNITE